MAELKEIWLRKPKLLGLKNATVLTEEPKLQLVDHDTLHFVQVEMFDRYNLVVQDIRQGMWIELKKKYTFEESKIALKTFDERINRILTTGKADE